MKSTSRSTPTETSPATGSATAKMTGNCNHGLACVRSIMTLKLRPHELHR